MAAAALSANALTARPSSIGTVSTSTLSTQPTINDYVVAHGKGSYHVAVAALKESCQAIIEKKSSKMPAVMKELTQFRLDQTTFVSLLHLLKAEDLKVVRYAHYFILQVAEDFPEKAIEAISMLEREARNENIGRKIFGLRTYASLCPWAGATTQLIMLLSQELDKVASTAVDSKKKSLFARKPTASSGEMKALQFYALFSAARSVPNLCRMGGLPLPHVCAGLQAESGAAVRHALALISDLIEVDASSIARELHPLLDLKKINLTDTLANIYFTQVCAKLARNPGGRLNPSLTEDFYRALGRQTGRSNPRVFLESAHGLSSFSYSKILTQKTVEGKPLDQAISERLTKILSDKSVVMQHAGCRALAVLAKSFLIAQDKGQVPSTETNPYKSIVSTHLRDFKTSPSLYLRVQTLICHLWVSDASPTALHDLSVWIISEICDRTNPSQLIVSLFVNLYERTQITSQFAPLLLDLSKKWFSTAPKKCDGSVLVRSWASLCSISQLRPKILQVAFEILEYPRTSADAAHIADIQRQVIHFLGKNFVTLGELESETQTLTCGLGNAHAILLRLQHAAMFSIQSNRTCAVNALGHLAITVTEPLAFEIYQFLFKLANGASGVQFCAGIYVGLLDEKYALLEKKISGESVQKELGEWDFRARLIVGA